jgi:tetratricopeptide (TPR) repeat protein
MSEQPTNKANISSAKMPRKISITIATLMLALIAIVVAVQQSPSPKKALALERTLDNQRNWLLETRGNKEASPLNSWSEIREGIEYYQNKDYAKAIPIFQDYLENNTEASDYFKIEFYLAVSYLGQGETERSTALLEELVQNNNAAIKEDATWYLSLAYTTIGETEAAKQQLESLVESTKYAVKVRKILHPTKTNVALN